MTNFPGIVAKKVGMTRVIDSEGRAIPVTLLYADDQKVSKILTPERDGYHGVQVAYEKKAPKNMRKPDLGRLKQAGVEENFTKFKEYRLQEPIQGLSLGAAVDLAFLAEFKALDVTGVTKGRGFQGAIKRWGSTMGPNTHGSTYHRRTGSLGSNTTPGRVYKNKKMPGRMGGVQRTVQNLDILEIDVEKRVIALKGSVPGHMSGFVVLKPSIKAKTPAPSRK